MQGLGVYHTIITKGTPSILIIKAPYIGWFYSEGGEIRVCKGSKGCTRILREHVKPLVN